MSALVRAGSVIGAAAAACVLALAGGGPSAWATAGVWGGVLALAAAVLFWPTETPSRRLGQLIRAWREPDSPRGPDPRQGPDP
ncbi:hypothetical protein ACFV6E_03340 [Streptomyces sp. NPDC059785]|uniref:hypothetical protein n=1 Tax=Streptomyces sp. NPDC059785 TaxID=3346945 RepID=UPI0036493A35